MTAPLTSKLLLETLYEDIPLELLQRDPKNCRVVYHGIEELAESIKSEGLLQNLVIEPNAHIPDRFNVIAGNRRLMAIERLVKEGFWKGPVHCLIKSFENIDDAIFVNLSENINRCDVHPWDMGTRMVELMDSAGFNQMELSGRLGISQGTISRLCKFSRQLAPKVQLLLRRLPPTRFSHNQLLQLAALYDKRFDEPDEVSQVKALEKMLESPQRPKHKPREIGEVELHHRRVKRFVNMKAVPISAAPYHRAISEFLTGQKAYMKWPQYRK